MRAHPALVLNADFRPLSYFPLSLMQWQDAVRNVYEDKLSVVAEYDTWFAAHRSRCGCRRSWRCANSCRSRTALRSRASTCSCAIASAASIAEDFRGQGADVRSRHPALARRRDGWDNVVAACDPCNVQRTTSS